MSRVVLIATDADEVAAEVNAGVAAEGTTVLRVRRGRDVAAAVDQHGVDIAFVDLQIGSMGGIAVALQLRQESEAGRLRDVDIVMLIDRSADRFLADHVEPDAVILKPFSMLDVQLALASIDAATV